MYSPSPFRFLDVCRIQVLLGLVPAAAGIAALIGLHTGSYRLAGALGNLPPMRYVSAVCFLFCFAGLVFAALRKKTALLITSAIIILVTGLDFYQNPNGLLYDAYLTLDLRHVSRSQFHNTAISSVSFIFVGLAWVISCLRWKYRRLVSGSMGSFVLACGVSTIIGIAAGYPEMLRWGHSSEPSFYAGLAFAFTGAAIIYESRRKAATGLLNWSHYLPVGILVTGLILSFCGRQALHLQEVDSTDRTVALQLAGLSHTVESEMDRRITANERMAGRSSIFLESAGLPLWERDAWRYYHDFKTYQSLEFIAADGRVMGRVPVPATNNVTDLNSPQSEKPDALFNEARYKKKTVVSKSVRLGGTGIVIRSYSPIFDQNEFKGIILGVFRVDKFFDLTIPKEVSADYNVAIADGDSLIYSTHTQKDGASSTINQAKIITFSGTSFVLRIHPKQKVVTELSSRNKDLALLLGTLISILLSWSALLALRARHFNNVTETANSLLKSEIEIRKEIEKKHRETSTFREAILNGANYIIVSTDQNGNITSFNRTAEQLLGYTADEVVGKFTLDHFHDISEIARYGQELEKSSGSKPLTEFEPLVARARAKIADEREWTYTRKDETTFPVALSVTAIVDEQSNVTGFLAIGRDNSQLHTASRMLVESEGRFKAFVNNTPALTYIKDKFGRYRFVNAKFEKLFKVTQGSLIGKSDFAITGKADASKVFEIEKRVLETGMPEESFELVTLSDGRLAHFLFVRFVLPMAGGEDGLGVIAVDLSAQKAVEEELRAANNAAVESSRLKSEFLANISHEIRTPMNGVFGMLEVLLDTSLTENQREYATVIQVSAKSLMMILDDIFDFSKLEAGKLLFETIEFDLRSTVESTIALYAAQCEAKQIEIAALIAPDVPTGLLGDPSRVKQVLTNLIGNAVKFTERGEVTLRINKTALSDERVTLRFVISDTGIGIAEETQKSLFNAFVQADGSLVRKYGGTGLGLSISKHLVEMMNGQISVQSRPGLGSTFRFTAVFGLQRTAKLPIPIVELSGVKVLIADDHEANRESISSQLQGLGMKTVSVHDGESCIKELALHSENGEPFEIVLLDYEMPGLNGFETAEFIKQSPRISDTRIVLMPSFGRRGHAQVAVEKGISAYLIKPVRQVELFDCVSTIMGGGKADAAGADQTQVSGSLITRHSMLENRNEGRTPILIVAKTVGIQNTIGVQLELVGYRSEIVSDFGEAIEALNKRSYSIVFMEIDEHGLLAPAGTGNLKKALETVVPVIGIASAPSEIGRVRALETGMNDYLSLPIESEQLRSMIARFLGATTEDGSIEKDDKFERSGPNIIQAEVYFRQLAEEIGSEMVALSISLFAEDATRHLGQMSDAIGAKDFEEIGVLAGSLGLICVDAHSTDIKESCDLLEAEAKKGDLDSITRSFEKLAFECESVIAQLERMELPSSVN